MGTPRRWWRLNARTRMHFFLRGQGKIGAPPETRRANRLFECFCGDVAAEVCGVEMDFFDSGVGGGLGGFQIAAKSGDAEDAAAAGDDLVAGKRGAGVEYFGVR